MPKKRMYTFRLDEEIIAILKTMANAGEFIRVAIREKLERERGKMER